MKKTILFLLCSVFILCMSYGCFNNESTYEIIFIQDGQRIVRTVAKGEVLTDIPLPKEKKGYVVTWDVSDFSTIKEDTIVKVVETPKSYDISFDSNGGNSVENISVVYDSPYTLPSVSRNGYIFKGWEYNGELLTSFRWEIDQENVILKASWKFSVTFKQLGYNDKVLYFNEGESVTEANAPSPQYRAGYDVSWGDLSTIKSNTVISAIETPKTIKVYFDGITEANIPKGETLKFDGNDYYKEMSFGQRFDKVNDLFTPIKSGYKFDCWSGSEAIDSSLWQWDEDVHLVADWTSATASAGDFVLSFRYNSVSEPIKKITVNRSNIISQEAPLLPREDGAFFFWDKDWRYLDRDSTITAFKSFNETKVVYDTKDLTVNNEYTIVASNGMYSLETPISDDGLHFNGWLYNGEMLKQHGVWEVNLGEEIYVTASWSVVISFVMPTGEAIVRLVPYGGSFDKNNAPQISQELLELGYYWNYNSLADNVFNGMTKNVTINLVAKKQSTKVTLKMYKNDKFWDEFKDGEYYKNLTLEYVYGESYELPILEAKNPEKYEFSHWTLNGKKITNSGIWNVKDEQVTLVCHFIYYTSNY